MPLLTPRDADAFPAALGALVRPEAPTKPDPNGFHRTIRPHLFSNDRGQLMYAPPLPPSKEAIERAVVAAEKAMDLKPTTPADAIPEGATHRHRKHRERFYKASGSDPDKRATWRNEVTGTWHQEGSSYRNGELDTHERLERIAPVEKPVTQAAQPAFCTIPHTDPRAKDVPWSEPGVTPPASFKGWLNAARDLDLNEYRYWNGSAWFGGGIRSTSPKLQVAGKGLDLSHTPSQIRFRPIHPEL